jgi:cytochrome P450
MPPSPSPSPATATPSGPEPTATPAPSDGLSRLSAAETAAVLAEVAVPLLARGIIIRRPRVTTVLDRLDADRRAVERLEKVRDRHGEGPVRLALPGRDVVLPLTPRDVRRILRESPAPFAPASREKRASLDQFEPHGVLVSSGAVREERRVLNETALQTAQPVHDIGPAASALVERATAEMTAEGRRLGRLGWDEFADPWWRLVRSVVFGESARDDVELTRMLAGLRRSANWSVVAPPRRRLRARFLARVAELTAAAPEYTLAGRIDALPAGPEADAAGQIPQWLFAFESAGLATFRALALLTAHPAAASQGQQEAELLHSEPAPSLPFLRRTLLESVRLWPTTPAILRETTAPTEWRNGRLPAGSSVLVYAPLFHRSSKLAGADSFQPELWDDHEAAREHALVPFSAGPGECPGRSVVMLLASLTLARLLNAGAGEWRADPSPIGADARLRGTFSPFRLRFEVASLPTASSDGEESR